MREPDAPSWKEMLTEDWLFICYAVYCTWALYWGVPAAWRWYLWLSGKVMQFVSAFPFGPVLRVLIPAAPIWVGVLMVIPFGAAYGFFGGAFYEYTECARVAGSAGKRIGRVSLGVLALVLGVGLVILSRDPLLVMLTLFGPFLILIGLVVLFAELSPWRRSRERSSD